MRFITICQEFLLKIIKIKKAMIKISSPFFMPNKQTLQIFLEQVMGIEPTSSDWKSVIITFIRYLLIGGLKGIWTLNFRLARATRSQLRHQPNKIYIHFLTDFIRKWVHMLPRYSHEHKICSLSAWKTGSNWNFFGRACRVWTYDFSLVKAAIYQLI